MSKISAILLTTILFTSGCHYVPFIKYYGTDKDTGFPRFTENSPKKETTESQHNYDVMAYDWHVKVNPEKKHIASTMAITFTPLESIDTLVFNLHNSLKISAIKADFPIKKWAHKKHLIKVLTDGKLARDQRKTITITYQGKPVNVAGEGPLQWTKDEQGQPWISTQTQGIGTQLMMPCKQLLYDEPEWCKINVEVPLELVAVANGKLDSLTKSPTSHTYHWSVDNPINIYNISFNIGDYTSFEKSYTDIESIDRKLHIYALKNDADTLSRFHEQLPIHMQNLEELFGAFPWWNDECKVVQSTLENSAMEHQSAISMGSIMTNDYRPRDTTFHINTTLAHELAHEWWGNSVTGKDFCDAWFHEGFATYAEALVIEKIYGAGNYGGYINNLARWVQNKRAILKPCGVKYNSWVNSKDYDIYYKGALMLHTVRRQLDDDALFFKTLKQAQLDFKKQNISTDEWVTYFNHQTNRDFTALYDLYLNHIQPPTLIYAIDSVNSALKYKWKKEMPTGIDFRVVYSLDNQKHLIMPTNEWQSEVLPIDSEIKIHISDFGYILFEKENDNN